MGLYDPLKENSALVRRPAPNIDCASGTTSQINAETLPAQLLVTQPIVWAERLEIAERMKYALSSSSTSPISPSVMAV
jgi:hypothetical protein